MALLDNLVLRVKAEAGQTVITDNVNGFLWNGGTGTTELYDDPTYGLMWRTANGTQIATLSGLPDWSAAAAGVTVETTFVCRFRFANRASYTKQIEYGQNNDSAIGIGNAGTATGALRVGVANLSNFQNPVLPPYTNTTVVTFVCRMRILQGGPSYTDLWVGTSGRAGTTPDYATTYSTGVYNRPAIMSKFETAGTAPLDILDYAVFTRGLTDAEAAALADDPRGLLYPSAGGTDATAPSATLTGTATLTPGSATGGVSGDAVAPGAALTGTATLTPGAASGTQNASAPGAALTGTASLAPGAAVASSPHASAPGATLTGGASLIAGRASDGSALLAPGPARWRIRAQLRHYTVTK